MSGRKGLSNIQKVQLNPLILFRRSIVYIAFATIVRREKKN